MHSIPYARKEVCDIASLFGNGSKQIFLGEEATEKNFRSAAPRATFLQIATHSRVSVKDPSNSTLIFAGSLKTQNIPDKNDGLLTQEEICFLNLNASLVTLSACATGEGKITLTEGILSMNRSFFIAGARCIVYSLWNIPDRLTSEIMTDFYRRIFHTKRYSEALREVKLKMISMPETSLPFMWAGFLMIGR